MLIERFGRGLSPAYNKPLISLLLGRDVGPGYSPVTMLRWCRQPSPSKATLALFLFATRRGILPTRARSPRPLKLFNRQRERGRRVRHAAELDHEVGGGSSIDGFEDHDGVGLAEQSEELVDHDVVRDLRVLEQAGRLLPFPREDPEVPHEEHGVHGGASRADAI